MHRPTTSAHVKRRMKKSLVGRMGYIQALPSQAEATCISTGLLRCGCKKRIGRSSSVHHRRRGTAAKPLPARRASAGTNVLPFQSRFGSQVLSRLNSSRFQSAFLPAEIVIPCATSRRIARKSFPPRGRGDRPSVICVDNARQGPGKTWRRASTFPS